MPSRHVALQLFSITAGIAALTVAIGLCGGASRGDVAINPIVQLFGLALIFLAWVRGHGTTTGEMRSWITLAVLAALWMALQLVPLPPVLWTMLPGRAVYAAEAAAVGIDQPWRPISLSPMSTWLSLVGMTVPIGLLLGWGQLGLVQVRNGLWVLTTLVGISALLGLAQVSGGIGGGLYLFDIGSQGFPAGLFANRNHQAAALAMVFPLFGIAIMEARIRGRLLVQVASVVGLATSLVLPLLLVNGSRAGLALALVTIALTVVMMARHQVPDRAPLTVREKVFAIGLVVVPITIAGLTFVLGRAAAIERFARLKVEDDQRYRQAATVVEMIRTHFPVGAGYGSFPQVFRVYEPFTSLEFSYFNHAHNDLIELAFEGGLPSILLALAALTLFIRQAWQVWVTSDFGRTTLYARAGTIMIVVLILASAGDYPLRTPTILVFATVALAWLSAGVAHLKSDRVPL